MQDANPGFLAFHLASRLPNQWASRPNRSAGYKSN